MILKDLLKKDKKNIIICPPSYNEGLFKEVEKDYFYDLSFLTKDNFIKNILGSYSDDALIFYTANDLFGRRYTIDALKSIISSLPYLDQDNKYKEAFKEYKVYNNSFPLYLKDKNILYFESLSSDLDFCFALKKCEEMGITLKKIEANKNPLNKIYLRKNINVIKEVENIIKDVASLLYKGSDINKIKIIVSDESYYSIFEDVLSFYNIPYHINKKLSIYETKEGLDFYKYLKGIKEDDDVLFTIDNLKDYLKDNEMSFDLKNNLLRFFASYDNLSLDFIKDYLMQSKIKPKRYKDALIISNNFDTYLSPNSILFLAGLNQGIFPKIIDLKSLFFEPRLEELNLPSLGELNSRNEEYIINKLYSLDNVYLSYSLKSFSNELSPSTIINKLKQCEDLKEEDDNHFSKKRDFLKYLKSKNIYDTFHNTQDNLKKYIFLKDDFKDYTLYNPIFNVDDFNTFKDKLDNLLKLSYSSLDDYYECPAKYYLNDILKIEPFETNYNTYLGSFFHKFIENFIDKDYSEFEVEELYKKYKLDKFNNDKYELSSLELPYFKIFYELLPKIHEILRHYRETSTFSIFGKEKRFYKEIENKNIKVVLTGSIDLVLKDDNDNTAVIDYKTGHAPKVNIEDGLSMQMFIYMYALKDKYPSIKPFGLFYQEIPKTETDLEKKKDIKFRGFKVPTDQNLLNNFAQAIDSKVYSEITKPDIESSEDLARAIDLVEDKIMDAKDKILSLDFHQTPSKESCKYCHFSEICYKHQLDDEEEGGDDNE